MLLRILEGRAVHLAPLRPSLLLAQVGRDLRAFRQQLATNALFVVAGATIDERHYLKAGRMPAAPVDDPYSLFCRAEVRVRVGERKGRRQAPTVVHAVKAPKEGWEDCPSDTYTRKKDSRLGKTGRVQARRRIGRLLQWIRSTDRSAVMLVASSHDFFRRRYGVPPEWVDGLPWAVQRRSAWPEPKACAKRALRAAIGLHPDAQDDSLHVEYTQGLEGSNEFIGVDWMIVVEAPFGPRTPDQSVWTDLMKGALVQAVGRIRIRERQPGKPCTFVSWGAGLELPEVLLELDDPAVKHHRSFDELLKSLAIAVPPNGRGCAPEARLLPFLLPEEPLTIHDIDKLVDRAYASNDDELMARVAGLEGFSGADFEDGVLASVRGDLGIGPDGAVAAGPPQLERRVRENARALGAHVAKARRRIAGYLRRQRHQFPRLAKPPETLDDAAARRDVAERKADRWKDLLPVCVRILMLSLLASCRSSDSRSIRRTLREQGFDEDESGRWRRVGPPKLP